MTFFDIHSTKARQFGFSLTLNNGKKLTFLGDEPYNPVCEKYVRDCDWLLHEAFCLYVERDLWKPYEKHHSTVKDACELAQAMQIPNLCCGIRKTATSPDANGCIRAKGRNIMAATSLCRTTKA